MEIRIIATPSGEAPLWVRQAWIGIVLPAAPYSGSTAGVVTKNPVTSNVRAYAVQFEDAILALERHNQPAATWWRKNEAACPRPNRMLIFSREVCEPLSLPELDIKHPPSHLAWG